MTPSTASGARDASGRGYADLGDVSLYYEIDGDGPSVVLIHGWTLNCRMWDDQVHALAARYRVVRYDRRGFGRSGGEPATIRDAEDLNALVTHLGLSRTCVLGMSQGGWAALYFALDYPEKTAGLVLHATVLPGFNLPFTGSDRVPSDRYVELANTQGLDAVREAWTHHAMFAVAQTKPDVAARFSEMVATYSGADLAQIKVPPLGGGRDAVTRLAQLSMPVLILIGDRDVPYLRLVARAQAYGIPHARLVVLPGCDHLANMEEPELYNDAVLSFLDTTS